MTLIKSISGIRGTIGGRPGDNLTPLDIVKFTTAYVRFLGERKEGRLRIVVGRDARLSGEMVGDLIEGALLGCGAGLLPFEPTRFAQTGSRWQQLSSSPYGGSANVTTSSLPPLT